MGDKIPYVFPVWNLPPTGEEWRLFEQQLPADGRIENIHVFFESGTDQQLAVRLLADGEPIQESEPTEVSGEIPDWLAGDGTQYDLDVDVGVFKGQTLGVEARNVSTGELTALVAYSVRLQED